MAYAERSGESHGPEGGYQRETFQERELVKENLVEEHSIPRTERCLITYPICPTESTPGSPDEKSREIAELQKG